MTAQEIQTQYHDSYKEIFNAGLETGIFQEQSRIKTVLGLKESTASSSLKQQAIAILEAAKFENELDDKLGLNR